MIFQPKFYRMKVAYMITVHLMITYQRVQTEILQKADDKYYLIFTICVSVKVMILP